MKSIFLIVFSFFLFSNTTFCQEKVDNSAKPEETTFFDGPANTVFAPGFLLKTRSKNYYEITGGQKQFNKILSPTVQVYKDKKKYKLVIQAIEKPFTVIKLQDVTESYIDGDFRGWDATTTFKLGNGDVWVQDEMKTLFSPIVYKPLVYIYTGSYGSYKMKVGGVDETLQVKKK